MVNRALLRQAREKLYLEFAKYDDLCGVWEDGKLTDCEQDMAGLISAWEHWLNVRGPVRVRRPLSGHFLLRGTP